MAMTEQQIQLVIAAQNGDMKSFEQLYALYYDKVYGLARMIIKNERDAEDILQETFITAWRKLDTLKTPPTFSVWIQIIAKNLCNMQLRRKNMVILLDAEQEMEDFDTEDTEDLLPAVYAERADLRERLGSIIEGLSEVQRQTIVLYYYSDCSVNEISEIMECSPGTVKSRLFLARNTIRTEVEEQERRSGQKFYGIAGIPMLPLGRLIQSHMESMTISQGVASASLGVIKNTITTAGSAASTATATSPTMTTAPATATKAKTATKEGTKMLKNLSLTAKILAGITAVAAVATVSVLVFVLATGGFKNLPPTGDDPTPDPITGDYSLDDLWDSLQGYWTTNEDSLFIGFFKDGDACTFSYGLYRSSYGFVGEITDIEVIDETHLNLTLHIAATEANEMDDARPERDEIIYLDITNLDVDGTIRVKIDNLGNGGWYVYTHGGDTLDEAFNQGIGLSLDDLWDQLDAYWTSEDLFIGFFRDGNDCTFEYGYYRSSFWIGGYITDFEYTDVYEVKLTLHIEATEANEVNGAMPERDEIIWIDLGNLDIDGSIRVKTDTLADGGWHTYTYGGLTLEDAFS